MALQSYFADLELRATPVPPGRQFIASYCSSHVYVFPTQKASDCQTKYLTCRLWNIVPSFSKITFYLYLFVHEKENQLWRLEPSIRAACLLSNLASSSHTVSRLSFLILCRSLIARARTPESKCVAVGEFAGDIGISFKVDMDFVCFVDGVFRDEGGE